MNIYVVGGAIRDTLLNLPCSDIDYVVVGSTPEEMEALNFKQVGADFPVFLCPNGDEYALARTERKVGSGYHGFETTFDSSVTIEDDLFRRDLTINSLAVALEDWEKFKVTHDASLVVDPFNGLDDIKDKLLRHTSECFSEDPVRLLRIARFQARYRFEITRSTMNLLSLMVESGEVDHLVPERVWAETKKAINLPNAMAYFWVLHRCGALEIVIPGLNKTMTNHGMSARASTLRNLPFLVRCMLIFGYVEDTSATLLALRAPTEVVNAVSMFRKAVDTLSANMTADEVLTWIKETKAESNTKIVYHVSAAVCVASIKDCVFFDKILKSLLVIQGISFNSLTDQQQNELTGKDIGNAIDVLKRDAILRVL